MWPRPWWCGGMWGDTSDLLGAVPSGIPCSGTPGHAATAAMRAVSGGGGGDGGGGGGGRVGGEAGWGLGLLLELKATPARDALIRIRLLGLGLAAPARDALPGCGMGSQQVKVCSVRGVACQRVISLLSMTTDLLTY